MGDDTIHTPIQLRRSRFCRSSIGAVALAVVSVLAAACGGGAASPGVASLGPTTTTTASSAASQGGQPNLQRDYQAQLAYSQCMRTHGEPTFPDPALTSHSLSTSTGSIDVKSPQYISASTACKRLVPDGGPPSRAQIEAAIQAALKHSKCMRSHGEPNFPDPNVSRGGISIRIGGDGVDPRSPQFQAAQRSCQKLALGY